MRGLFLYGLNCTNEIWNKIENKFLDMNITYVEYPHEITQKSKSVSYITSWVFDKYGHEEYDFIVGHSMGGIIALQLISEFGIQCDKVVFIESNLKPAGQFYRNLLTPKHMDEYGDKVLSKFKKENEYYTDSLKSSLQENFDYTHLIKQSQNKFFGIYGDRGQNDYPNKIKDLRLDEETINRIEFYFVEDSCHMPMIENPSDLYNIIIKILKR